MALAAGTRIGPYEIVAALGAGAWRRDGRELLYVNTAGEVLSVDVSSLPSLKPDGSRRLSSLPDDYVHAIAGGAGMLGDVEPGGSRLLVALPTTAYRPPALHVLVNWQ